MPEGVVVNFSAEEVLEAKFESALISAGAFQIGNVDVVTDCYSPRVDFSANHRNAAIAKTAVIARKNSSV